jgi:hypothetical protein
MISVGERDKRERIAAWDRGYDFGYKFGYNTGVQSERTKAQTGGAMAMPEASVICTKCGEALRMLDVSVFGCPRCARNRPPSPFEAWWKDSPEERPDIRMLAARSGWNAALEAACRVIDNFDMETIGGHAGVRVKQAILALREKV